MTDTKTLQIGDAAPAFTLSDQEGNHVSLSNFQGKKVIVYFYPAASTPGCTTQASAGFQVLGVSKDKLPALVKFSTDESINFPLLSDPTLDTHTAFGAWGEKSMYGKTVTGTIRSTFVIDESGKVELALYNVKATGHVAMLRKRLGLEG